MAPIPPVRPESSVTAPSEVRAAIRQASAATGVSFQYLVTQAEQESGLRTDARASGSSAAGLYQFIESTWLRMVREHGDKYGLGDLARGITVGPDSSPRVADAGLRARILALRDDPKLSATMAAEYARSNHAQLAQNLGREISPTDLYLAHFLGAGGAGKFLAALRAEPGRSAAELLPEAASANRSVFFDAAGQARSVREIYNRFAAKFDPGRADKLVPASAARSAATTRADFDFAAEATPGATRPLEAVLRRTALAALSGNVLSPTVIAALAALDAPQTANDREPRATREAIRGSD